MVTRVISVILYACETWTLKKKGKNKLMAFDMRCYQKILTVRWQKITNEEIRKRMGSKRNIIIIKERKLNLFGHICRIEDSRLIYRRWCSGRWKKIKNEEDQTENAWTM